MNYQKITNAFDFTSKVCALAIAPAIIFSTAGGVIFFHLAVLFSLLSGNLREKFSLVMHNPIVWSFLIFFLMFLIGTTYSTAPAFDSLMTANKYSKFLLAIMLFPMFVEEKWRERAVLSFMMGILLMLFASYLRTYGYLHWWAEGGAAVFRNSVEFSFLMAIAAYFCLVNFVLKDRYRWLWAIFFVMIVYTIFFRSIGRTGYFIFAALLVLFFLQRLRWKGLVIAITGVLLLFSSAYVFSPTFKNRIGQAISDVTSYSQNDKTSVGLRITFVRNGLKLIKANPFFGTGTGSYITEYMAIKPTPPDLKIINPPNPHNSYTYIGVQFGIVGLILLLLFWAVPLWYSKFLPEKEKYIVRGIVLAMVIGSFTDTHIRYILSRFLYMYFIAMSFGILGVNKGGKSRHKS